MKFKSLLQLALAGFFVAPAFAQTNPGTVALDAVAIGRGPGVSGFKSAVPSNGLALIGNASGPPTFQALSGAGFGSQTANRVFAGPASGAAASPSFRAIVGADLPLPAVSTLGGVFSKAAVTSNWLRSLGTDGNFTASQPNFTDLAGSLACSQHPALTGDITASAGSCATTLATVNSNVGSFGSSTAIPNFTVNAKGLITAAGSSAVVAPAGTLTGGTLAANVLSSSLTSVGTLTSLTTAAAGVTAGTAVVDSNASFAARFYSNNGSLPVLIAAGSSQPIVFYPAGGLRGTAAADGGWVFGNTATSQGAGTVNAQGGFYVNNTALNKTHVGLANVANVDQTDAGNISSGTLNTARLPSPFTSGTRSGNTSAFVTLSGSATSGRCLEFDASGNATAAAAACGGGGGSGTVNSGTANQLAYYATSGTAVSGLTSANNAVLVTNGSGVPSLSTTLPAVSGANLTGTAAGLTAGTVTTNANLTGEVTSSGNAATVTNSAVIGKVITGYTSGAGTVAATDTILQAIQKLNGNDGLKAPLASPTFTGTLTTPALNVSSATVSTAAAFDASKNLISVTNTGTGNNVLATSPTLVTPALGTPSSAVLTNAIGLPLTTGVTGVLPAANGGVDTSAWTAWTPTYTSGTGSVTGATITQTARYKQVGKSVTFTIYVTLTNVGSGSPSGTVIITQPPGLTVVGTLGAGGQKVNDATSVNAQISTDGKMYVSTYNGGTLWSNGTVFTFGATYEVP